MAWKKILRQILRPLSEVLLVAGGLNWGLTTLNVNLVELLTTKIPVLATVVYALVGLAAVYRIALPFMKK